MLAKPEMFDSSLRNILFLTDESSSRKPFPSISVRNQTEMEFCYARNSSCIVSTVLQSETWHSVLLLTRKEGRFEVFVNNECVGGLHMEELVEPSNVLAMAAAPWFRFRQGWIRNLKHSALSAYAIPTPSPTVALCIIVSNCLQDRLDDYCASTCHGSTYARFDGQSWKCYKNLVGKTIQTRSCVDARGDLIPCQDTRSTPS